MTYDAQGSFGSWLSSQLERANKSPAEFARDIGVTKAAVTAWIMGRSQPHADLEAEILTHFGAAAAPVATSDEAQFETSVGWRFRPAHADGGREYGNAAIFAFDVDPDVLVREATQNSLDERVDPNRPVRVHYTLHELTGSHCEAFLRAMRWSELAGHYRSAATQSQQKVARSLNAALNDLDTQKSLLLLRIDDYNASGLTGDDYGDGRFAAVVRRQLDSRKESAGAGAGGSYGLGKATLWATSRFGMVLINSTLYLPQAGRTERRLIGRLDLPWHTVGDNAFAGPAWFGEPDSHLGDVDVSKSWWADEVTVRALHLERYFHDPGTSFLIVGAHDGSGNAETLTDLHRAIVEALGRQFWAAMVTGRDSVPKLEARVTALRNGEVVVADVLVDPHQHRPALSRALQAYLDGETVDALTGTDQVVRVDVPLSVTRRRDEDRRKPKDTEHRAVLLLAPSDEGSESDFKVAYMRGSRMTVQEKRPRSLPLGAIPFQAVLLAGGATERDGDDVDRAERFLRASEPPEHNRWGRTEELSTEYERGAGTRIEEFLRAVDKAVYGLVGRRETSTNEGPAGLRELLKLDGGSGGGAATVRGTQGAPSVVSVSSTVDDSGAWRVRIRIRLPESESPWLLVPVAKFDVRSGGRPAIRWKEIEEIQGCVVEDGLLMVAPGTRMAEFSGITDPSSHPVLSKYARLVVELRQSRGAKP
ncbi:helix-turn-helix domain-containing protein [Nocardia sp. NPDC127526]|uniref:helix-turn-helix domain-containing protein n=1 Tax=Nocardia sp. NPDC127526 TaxID=3345393 RepID=UPI0036280839